MTVHRKGSILADLKSKHGVEADVDRINRERAEASIVTTRCGLCKWTWTGPFLKGRSKFQQHRRRHA